MAKQRPLCGNDATRGHLKPKSKSARRRLAAAVEILEVRRLLASVSGHVFVDPNPDNPSASHTWASGDAGLGGWQVYLDANQDGQLDSGDPSTTTNSNGWFSLHGLLAAQAHP